VINSLLSTELLHNHVSLFVSLKTGHGIDHAQVRSRLRAPGHGDLCSVQCFVGIADAVELLDTIPAKATWRPNPQE
jgi:hypothetical protein